MHLLSEIPGERPRRQPEWLKSGFVLTWTRKQRRLDGTDAGTSYSVRLIVFQPPADMLIRLARFIVSPRWQDATLDPYVLVDLALYSWYERIDRIAWDVTNRARVDEEVFCPALSEVRQPRS